MRIDQNKDGIENAIQIIMGDREQGHSQSMAVSLAEVLHQCYYSRIAKTTFYTILLVTEGSMLAIVTNSFLNSVQLPSQANFFFSLICSYLQLQLQDERMRQIWNIGVRLFIVLLNLTVVLSLLALIFRPKQQSLLRSFLLKNTHYLVTTLLTLSVPFIYFSISHIFADSSFQTYFSDILDAFNVICLMGSIYAFQLFAVEAGSEYPYTSVLRNYRSNSGKWRIMKLTAIFLLAVPSQGLQVGLFCLFVLQLTQLKCLSRCRKYINTQLQSLSQLISTVWISSSLVMLLASSFSEDILDNLAWVFGAATVLLYISVGNYIRYQRRKVMILGEDVQKEEQAIAFAWQYLANLNMAEERGDIIHKLLMGLFIQKHQARCMETACKCHEKPSSWTESSDIVNLVTEQLFRTLLSKFPYSFSLKFISIWFKLSHSLMIVNVNHQIGQFLKKKNLKAFSFAELFIVKETKKRIREKLLEYNCVDNHIKAENIFLQQSIKADAQVIINNIILEMLQKHKLLQQDFYTLNAIQSCCLRINKGICAMEQIWLEVCSINSFNHQLYRLFIFYYQNGVPSQIEGKKITSEIMLKLDKLKHLRGFSKDIINKYIYSRKSCVIQSNLQNSFGVITNVSKYCLDVLGKSRQELLHKDINSVMPEYFAKNHQQTMQLWLATCTFSKYQTDIVEIGYVDATQTCFQGCFLMKIFPGEESLLFYSVIIRENDNDYVLLNHNKQIEGIGKRIIKEGVFSSQNIKHKFNEYVHFNFDKKLTQGQKFRAKLFLQNTTQSEIPQYSHDNQTSIEQQFSSKKLVQSPYRYECTVIISKLSIGREFYYLIKFQNITKWVSSSCKHIQAKQRIGFGSSGRVGSTLKLIDEDLHRVDEYESVEAVTNNIRFTQLLNLSIKNSSLASNGFSEAAYYNHFIKDIKRKLIEPTLLRLPLFRKLTILLLFLTAGMAIQLISLGQLFQQGFRSFNNVMFGDGAVSDNNQILQILYNDVHMSRIYCRQQLSSPRCQYLLNSTASLGEILYDLYLQNVQVFLQNKTTLSGLKFYASYDIPVNFSLGLNSKSKQISTLQFMEYFYGAAKKLLNEVAAGRGDSRDADLAMGVLLSNWQTMKFINHNSISFYLHAGQVELDMLLKNLLLLGAILVSCIVALGVGLKGYENSILKKKVGIMAIHGCMTGHLLRDITDYYCYLKGVAQDLKFLPDKFQPTTEDHTHHENRREMKYNQNKLCLMQIIIIVLLIAILGSLEILKIGLVLPSCMMMVHNINHLMGSENYLLQNYFQLKTYYLTYNFSKSVDQISSEIAVRLNQTEPVFTQVAKGSIDIFSADPTFTQDFNNLLIKDVCQLTAWVFQPWQVLYCMYNFTTPVLQHGLVNAMTFFQRNAFSALTELQSKQQQNINKTAYFQQDIFKDIDDSIFYMFRLYQATQVRMYQGLTYIVNSSIPYLDTISTAAISILVLVVCWWLKSYRGQQQEMGQLYGTVLQFPQAIMKPEIIAKIKKHLELEH